MAWRRARNSRTWIEFEDWIETFLTVAEDVEEKALEMTYRPEEGSVLVDGPREQTIDVSEVQERASDWIRWSFDGTYYELGFLKE